jgi:hypothetical protein
LASDPAAGPTAIQAMMPMTGSFDGQQMMRAAFVDAG